MRYAPNTFKPSAVAVRNGRPAWGKDADGVDRYTTWLAASRRHPMPAIVGAPLTAAHGATSLKVRLPHYTASVRVEGLATGAGIIRLALAGDSYYVDVQFSGSDQHDVTKATPWATGARWLSAHAVNGLNRALDHALSGAPDTQTWTITVLDDPDTDATLKVWAVNVRAEMCEDQLS